MPSIEQLEKLLAANDRDAFVLYALGQEHAQAGDHETALDYYDRCLAVDALYAYAYYHKARSLESLDRIADARDTLTEGLDAAHRAGDAKAVNEITAYLADPALTP